MSDTDFDIEVRKRDGQFEFEVDSPGGNKPPIPATDFPYSGSDLTLKLTRLELALSRSSGMLHRGATTEQQEAQDFGRDLFAWLMQGEVRTLYERSVTLAGQQQRPLRVRITVEDPAIAALPWEFLWESDNAQYVVLSSNTPVIRYPELGQSIETLAVTPPLRILGMISQPKNMPELNAGGERDRIDKATKKLQEQGLVEVTWLETGTWRDLQAAVRQVKPHVFHFVGHGAYDPRSEEGVVCFVGDDGMRDDKTGGQLNLLLQDSRSLRLVILNACEGANGSDHNVFSSTAATLIRGGIPAVIAMQYAITDGAATEFSQSFYSALVQGSPVDEAVAEGRKGIALKFNNSLEWATPVLYMRSPDGVLFDVAGVPAAAVKPGQRWTLPRNWRDLPNVAWLAIAATIGLLASALLFLFVLPAIWPPGASQPPGSVPASTGPGPSPSLSPADVALVGTLPVSVTGNCWHHNTGGAESADQMASIRCSSDSTIQQITLQTYRNGDVLRDRWFYAMGNAVHPAGTSGACWDGMEGESAWSGGRFQCDRYRKSSCDATPGDAELRWTNDARNLYGAALGTHQTTSIETLRRWWQAILEPSAEPAPMTESPSPSACATNSPSATVAPAGTLPPSTSATPASAPPTAAALSPGEQALKDMVPADLREPCVSHDFPGGDVIGYTVGLQCDVGRDGVRFVKYAAYASQAALDSQWADNLALQGFAPGLGDCPGNIAGENSWTNGRMECHLTVDYWVVRWTDDPTVTYGAARAEPGMTAAELYDWVLANAVISR